MRDIRCNPSDVEEYFPFALLVMNKAGILGHKTVRVKGSEIVDRQFIISTSH
jgi:hypothetical protein